MNTDCITATITEALERLPGRQGERFATVFQHGSLLVEIYFVAAGTVHRFENFSGDLTLWVIFYGPEGGESA